MSQRARIDFCWLPPLRVMTWRGRTRGAIPARSAAELTRLRSSGPRTRRTARDQRIRAERCDADVAQHGQAREQAFVLAVLGDEPGARLDRLAGRRRHARESDEAHVPADVLGVAADGPCQLVLARPEQAADAHDLAAPDLQVDVADAGRDVQAVDARARSRPGRPSATSRSNVASASWPSVSSTRRSRLASPRETVATTRPLRSTVARSQISRTSR